MSDSYIRPDDKPAAADNSHGAEWGAPKAAPSNAMGANVIQKNWQELIRPNKLQVSLGSDPKTGPRRWSPNRSSAVSA